MPADMTSIPRHLKIMLWMLAAVAIGLALFIRIKTAPPPNGKYDALAQCIASSSTKFYGAFWCPHCREQKDEFGDAAHYLPYVECSLPDGSSETQFCIDRGIKHYPTWIFPDGSKLEGVVSPEELGKRTGCE